ncbi:MAG: hypothetical protein IKY52_08385 [Clostridia bacterium]|nr:hypothetical protein [Clostridia bacterium]
MKRMISYLLVTVIMLGVLVGCDTAPKEVEEHTFPDAEYAVNATDMAVVGDKIYYISDEKVYETASEAVVFEEFPAQFLASNGKELAVYGSGQVWCGEETYTVPQSEISSFVYADSTFCWSYMKGDLPQIGFYNIGSGETISVNPLTGVECDVISYQNADILVVCYEFDGSMAMYDFSTETMKPGKLLIHDTILGCAFNAADSSFSYISAISDSNARMTVYPRDTNEESQYAVCVEMRSGVDKLLFSGGSAIFTDKAGSIFVRANYIEDAIPNAVTVLVDEFSSNFGQNRIAEISDAVFDQYGIEIIVKKLKDTSKLPLKLLAGDSDFDLYLPSPANAELYYPVYEPLNDYPVIMEQFDTMLDEVREICTYDGKIFGVPAQISVGRSVMGYDAELLAKLGLSLPDENWTLDDFYALAKQVRAGGAYISANEPLRLPLYVYHFCNQNVQKGLRDDGTVLRKLLETTKKLHDEGLLYNPETDPADAPVLFFFSNESSNFWGLGCDVWYLPTFDGTPVDDSTLAFLQMNVNSKHKEEAAIVMAEFIKQWRSASVMFGPLYRSNAEELAASGEVSAKQVEIFKKLLSIAVPEPNIQEFYAFAYTEAKKYYNNEQDLEYTIALIYDKAKMYFEE